MERLTKFFWNLQQRTPEWELERKNTITGSGAEAFKPKVRGTGFRAGYYKLLADDIAMEKHEGKPMDWGTNTEPLARAEYEKVTGNKVVECGFVRNGRFPFIGYSPDGLVMSVEETPRAKIGLEMKCPTTHIFLEYFIETCVSGDTVTQHLEGLKYVPSDYHEQTVHSFVANDEQEELHFFIYDPTLEKNNYIFIVIKRADILKEIEEMLAYEIRGYEMYLKHKELFINF